jgi:colanic acid biosynthesis glycosyl transferase WcaI
VKDSILIISQVFVPDPAAVGQYMADAAIELARRGHRVRVLTSASGFEDPSRKYPRRENMQGVDVIRLPLSSFGKNSMALRMLGAISFVIMAFLRGLFMPGIRNVLVSTSPPFAPAVALALRWLRGVRVTYWAMDLNPDQAVAMGMMSPNALLVRAMRAMYRGILKHADRIITLDTYMGDRLKTKGEVGDRLVVLPLWPHEDHLEAVPHNANPFRREHGLDGKFVFMYSGNMTNASPLTTLLDAIVQLRDRDDLVFMFIGGGAGKAEIERYVTEHRLTNVVLLPYQPLAQLKYSLSAADVHIVSLGNRMVGILHPCKIYGAMSVARPVLLLGPERSHVWSMLSENNGGWRVDHGQADTARELIEKIAKQDPNSLAQAGARCADAIRTSYNKEHLCAAFCDEVTGVVPAIASAVPVGVGQE